MAFSRPAFPRARVSSSPVVPLPDRPSLIRALVAMLLAAAVLAVGVQTPRAGAVEPLSPELRGLAQGVDASKWQHPSGVDVDWRAAAASGKTFAFIKATDGAAPGNDFYADDVAGARAAGMVVGSYHKAHPAQDPTAQATAFATRIQQVGGQQLPPVLDIELDEGLSPAALVGWIRTFLTETERLTGRKPIVYTYRWFWITKTGNSSAFTSYPLWIAEYNVPQPTFPLVGGWSEWTFWQRAGNDGTSPGFPTAVDLNVFSGSRDQLRAWVGPVSPAKGAEQVPDKPTTPVPAAQGGTKVAGSSVPTKITIPAIPGVKLPAGLSLPMTIPVPAGALDSGSATDLVSLLRSPQIAGVLGALPPELAKAVTLS